jgi:DNA-binding FadR family transcriptional regulator
LKEGDETASLDYHKKILAAIQSRDKTLAKRYLNAHLDDVLASAGKKKAVKIRILEKKRNGKVYF